MTLSEQEASSPTRNSMQGEKEGNTEENKYGFYVFGN